jgi:2-methylisocitrate lyase-like PEP mutase family enzyme
MASLRRLLAAGSRPREPIAVPGATDALSAKLIEAHGFDCVYIGSYATAASRFGLPDTGLLTLDALVEQARTLAQAVRIPVIADAEGGFNEPADMARTVQAFERAGVAAIHIEDHTGAGKHTSAPQTLRSARDTAARIRAAVAARENPDFLIVARSDAFWIARDLNDCIARLEAYAAAGADMVFPTAVGPAELAEVRRRVDKPAMVIDMAGRTLEEHRGAALVLYYAFSTLVQFGALDRALRAFKPGERPTGQAELESFLLSHLKGSGSSEAGR